MLLTLDLSAQSSAQLEQLARQKSVPLQEIAVRLLTDSLTQHSLPLPNFDNHDLAAELKALMVQAQQSPNAVKTVDEAVTQVRALRD